MSHAVAELEARIGYSFSDPARLERALTHPSFLQDHPTAGGNNQRLEFLGDSVLQLVLTEALFSLFPEDREGDLTKRRAVLGKGQFLARLARDIGLDACIRLGANEESTGGRNRDAALEDAFEAMIGAVNLDGGFEAARRTALGIYGSLADRLAAMESHANPKGRLQEIVQPEHGNNALRYELIATEGADHEKVYEVGVHLQDRHLGTGRGTSKKVAEEEAARAALRALEIPKAQ
ncbi:MAG TPA: ribonuclease III [Opitutaceae bacterium]|jgi:ribonuclease-3|nr:ribonuclease III [Opitutaceae bacterium]